MKKSLIIVIVVIALAVIGGIMLFGEKNENLANGSKTVPDTKGKSLVAYFSMPEAITPENMNREEEYSTVVIDGKVLGNTEYVAKIISEETGADIFRIESKEEYPRDHAKLESIAVREQREEAYPEIKEKINNIDEYTTIFVGYPNWYYDMPRIIYSFFNDYDLSGKTIVPFVTSGGSGFSNSINTLKSIEKDATIVENGLSIHRNDAEDAKEPTIKWLKEIGF